MDSATLIFENLCKLSIIEEKINICRRKIIFFSLNKFYGIVLDIQSEHNNLLDKYYLLNNEITNFKTCIDNTIYDKLYMIAVKYGRFKVYSESIS